jgi:cyanophycinase
MQNNTLLFLLGGPGAYLVYADEFVASAGRQLAVMAVLAQSLAGWEKYKTGITRPWLERGVTHFIPIVADESGKLDQAFTLEAISKATGILICGGNTPTYHRLFATGPIRALIRERYHAGVSVAGISAGALVSMDICQLTPEETGQSELKLVQGLSLANGFVIGVHFTELNALPEVLEVMAKSETSIGYGIDEPACLLCENGRFIRALGKSVYRIEMTDFDKQAYQIFPLS